MSSASGSTRTLFVRMKSTARFTSKFASDTASSSHLKSNLNRPEFSHAGWWLSGRGSRKLAINPIKLNQQWIRTFRGRDPQTKQFRKDFRPPALPQSAKNTMSRCQTMSDSFFRPFAFTALVGVSSFTACSIWKYEEYRSTLLRRDSWFSRESWKVPSLGPEPQTVMRLGVDTVTEGEKVFWVICGINAAVFLAWRSGALCSTMVTYFTANPFSRAVSLPMLLSTFSHYSFYHFAINMFVLRSFMPAAVGAVGKQEFLSLYLTAGVVSSLGSHLYKVWSGMNIPSLGASGAIMAIMALVCTTYPDTQLGIVFLPGVSFSADTALRCMIAVDTVGLLAGWKFIDHAAHLSGTLFGIAYSKFGHHLNPARDCIIENWHEFRNRSG